MIAALFFFIATAQTAEANTESTRPISAEDSRAVLSALGVKDADIERARRGDAFRQCLYGKFELGGIAGLPENNSDRPAFLRDRRAACADARSISEQANVELLSSDTALNETERLTKARKSLDRLDAAFEERVLRPEAGAARSKAFRECVKKKGLDDCLK